MNEPINKQKHDNEESMTNQESPATEQDVNATANGDVPAEELDIEELKATIVRLRKESETNLDGWQRSRAEFDNFRRRKTREVAESKAQGAIEAFIKMLPVFDDFERAFDNIPPDLEDNPWVTGTSLILKNIQKIFNEYDIEALDPVGEEFDPNMHEAIGMDDSSDYESGIVTTTLQKGYKLGDKILRPALVRVAS